MIKEICTLLGIDDKSTEFFEKACKKIFDSAEAAECFELAKKQMFNGERSFKEHLGKIAEASGVHRYTSDMVFWLLCAQPLREIYKKEGLPDELCLDCLRDLVYKNNECLKIYGIPGTSTQWFQEFFTLNRFAIGRLEYDVSIWEKDNYNEHLKTGDYVFACHIPSSGPLTTDAVIDSIKKLYQFAKKRDWLNDGKLAISCSTWLLYPPMVALLDETSNIRKFYDIFDIILVDHMEHNPYANFDRVFYKSYNGKDSLKTLPEDTKLQRTLKNFYLKGGVQGVAVGVVIFDGERIINK